MGAPRPTIAACAACLLLLATGRFSQADIVSLDNFNGAAGPINQGANLTQTYNFPASDLGSGVLGGHREITLTTNGDNSSATVAVGSGSMSFNFNPGATGSAQGMLIWDGSADGALNVNPTLVLGNFSGTDHFALRFASLSNQVQFTFTVYTTAGITTNAANPAQPGQNASGIDVPFSAFDHPDFFAFDVRAVTLQMGPLNQVGTGVVIQDVTAAPAAVPEPASVALLGAAGLAALGWRRRRTCRP